MCRLKLCPGANQRPGPAQKEGNSKDMPFPPPAFCKQACLGVRLHPAFHNFAENISLLFQNGPLKMAYKDTLLSSLGVCTGENIKKKGKYGWRKEIQGKAGTTVPLEADSALSRTLHPRAAQHLDTASPQRQVKSGTLSKKGECNHFSTDEILKW